MSMIGLFTTAPQTVTATTPTDDASAASGFGSALQEVLDTLTGGAHQAEREQQGPEEQQVEEQQLEGHTAVPNEALTATTGAVPTAPATARPLMGLGEGPESPTPAPVASENHHELPPVLTSQVDSDGDAVPAPTVPADEPAPPAGPLVSGQGHPVAAPAGSTIPLAEADQVAPVDPVPRSASGAPAPSLQPVDAGESVAMPTPAASGTATHPERGARVAGTPVPTATVPAATAPADGVLPAPPGEPVAGPASNPLPAPTHPASVSPAASTAEPAVPAAASVAAPAPAQAAAPTAPVTVPAPTASVPFAVQLARPIFSLAAAGAGDHVMTISVTPESLGPVTVRAHVGAEGVRVELFAPNDLGREAIRAVMPELRRDLAAAGLGGNLSLSSHNEPAPDTPTQHSGAGAHGQGRAGAERLQGSEPTQARDAPQQSRPAQPGGDSTIDVLA